MSEFLSFAERIKEVGVTVIVIGLAVFFLIRYMPGMAKQQGTLEEVIRNCSATISNNTEVLRLVTARDAETRESLDRIEKRVDEINLDVHDIKTKQSLHQHRRD